jgi:predicted RNA-binding Zn-ribbon protein involved in translation (DUF1610 family)
MLFIVTDHSVKKLAGPMVEIDCPNCGERRSPASSFERRTDEVILLVFHRQSRTHWVECTNCGARQRSRVPVVELEGETPEALAALLYPDTSPPIKTIAIAALICSPFPAIGLVLPAAALILTRKVAAWPRTLARVALAIGVLVHISMAVLHMLVPPTVVL